ncbi:MAG: hypothetical protein COB15_08085 [Flavobacteriales bacterium]|nr:MAG: hypothetical protein COB15_08085 [Flavobacteriales bacterium]
MDFTTGVYCGVTEKKPTFAEKCTIKEFGEGLEQKIVELDSNLKLIENRKSGIYLHLYTFLGIALIVLIADYLFTIALWETGWMTTITLIIGATGLGLIPYAVTPLNKFKNQLKIANKSVLELDFILELYNIQYEIETKLLKDSHDIINIENTLVIIKNNKRENIKNYSKTNAKLSIDY